MRQASDIREELDHLDQALAAFGPDSAGSELPGVALMRGDLEGRRVDLLEELSHAEAADLMMVLDGPAVTAGGIQIHSLIERLSPFEKVVTAVAQALEVGATKAGMIQGEVLERSSVLLAGTFPGSFGLHLAPPPVEEQLSLFEEDAAISLFERSVDRVLDIIDAASTEDYEQAIVDQVAGLGQRAVGHLVDLSRTAGSADLTRVELLWRHRRAPQRRSVLNAARGGRIQEVLSTIVTNDSDRPIRGRLVEASLVSRSFGIEVESGEIIKGTVDEAVAHRIEEYFGKDIEGTVTVITTRSTISDRSADRYILKTFAGPLGE